MGAPQAAVMGLISRPLPAASVDNVEAPIRLTRFREQIVQSIGGPRYGVADEGGYFVVTNPTPGTAIAHVTSAAVSETAGYYFLIRNGDSPGGTNKRMYLDYIRLICKAVPTTGSAGYFFIKTGPLQTRYTSGGSRIYPVNANADAPSDSIALAYAGALTTVADAQARIVANGMLRSVIPVAGDEWIFKFGGVEGAGPSSLGGTVALRMPVPCAPIILGPGQNAALQIWFTSNNAAAEYEIDAGWWER